MLKRLCLGCKHYKVEGSKCTRFLHEDDMLVDATKQFMDAKTIREKKCGIDKPKYYVPVKEELKKYGFYDHLKISPNYEEFKFHSGYVLIFKSYLLFTIASNQTLFVTDGALIGKFGLFLLPFISTRLYYVTSSIFEEMGKTKERIKLIEDYEFEQFNNLVNKKNPFNPTELSGPIESIELNNSDKPINPTDPINPAEPINPTKPTELTDPTNSTGTKPVCPHKFY